MLNFFRNLLRRANADDSITFTFQIGADHATPPDPFREFDEAFDDIPEPRITPDMAWSNLLESFPPHAVAVLHEFGIRTVHDLRDIPEAFRSELIRRIPAYCPEIERVARLAGIASYLTRR